MAPRNPLYVVYPPRFESLEALDLGFAELARLEALEKHVRHRIDERILALTKEAQEELAVILNDKDGKPLRLTAADWRKMIEEAAEEFCTKRRRNFLEDGKKSRELNHATFGWRSQKPRLEGELGDLAPILSAIVKLVEKATGYISKLAGFLRIKIEWDRAAILKGMVSGSMPAAIRERIGGEVINPPDKFYIELKTFGVESQPAESPA